MTTFQKLYENHVRKNKQNMKELAPSIYTKANREYFLNSNFYAKKTIKFKITSENIHFLTYKLLNQVLNQLIKSKGQECSLFVKSDLQFFKNERILRQ